jgi:hypothetical protein
VSHLVDWVISTCVLELKRGCRVVGRGEVKSRGSVLESWVGPRMVEKAVSLDKVGDPPASANNNRQRPANNLLGLSPCS